MTVEILETKIILRADNEHEKDALKRLVDRTVKISSLDDWDREMRYNAVQIEIPSKDDWGT